MYFFCFISPLILTSTLMELYLNNAPSLTLKLSFHCPRFKELAWFCRCCQCFKGSVSERGSMTSSGSVSNHLWCRRYKDSIHLLAALCSHCGTDNYLTVPGQQGLCRPLLLLCQWRKCAFQNWVHPGHWMLWGLCVYELENGNQSVFALGKPILQQENVEAFDNLIILPAWNMCLRAN